MLLAYESESYWDKEKHQPRNRRKLIGKLDDDGKIVPTGKSGRKKKKPDVPAAAPGQEAAELRERLADAEAAVKERELRIALLEGQKKEVEATLRRLLEILSQHRSEEG